MTLLLGSVSGFFLLVYAAASVGPALARQTSLQGETAPELQFTEITEGSHASLSELRGSVVLVNLWATWCSPCIGEMPELERLQNTYRDSGLIVLQISDEPQETIAEYLASSPMTTVHGYVGDFPWPEFGRPTTFVVDRGGILRRVIQGPRTFEQFEKEIMKYL
jgi:thiol-disulfide isomerase/thioredoxin